MIKTIIFDMDGVILDSEPIKYRIENDIMKQIGIVMSDEEHSKLAGLSIKDVWGKIVNGLSITNFFFFLVTGDDIKESKPNPEIFTMAAKLSNSNPDECLVIEDSTNGIIAAKAAGMSCIAYKDTSAFNQQT